MRRVIVTICDSLQQNELGSPMRQTTIAKPGSFEQAWHLVDAQDKVLGRLAAELAVILMGKHKPIYTPHVDTGDYVVVVNAAGIRLTGRKGEQSFHLTYSGYPGGQKATSYGDMLEKDPGELLRLAVKRMLPKNSTLGDQMLKKLKIFRGESHPHKAQNPQPLDFGL